jgi:hypothetical protein
MHGNEREVHAAAFQGKQPGFSGRVEWRDASFAAGDERQIASAADIIHENLDSLYGISLFMASPAPLPINLTSHGKRAFSGYDRPAHRLLFS